MKTMKKLLFFVLALLFLMGCQAKPATDDTDSDDAVRAWFAAEEPVYCRHETERVPDWLSGFSV